MQEDQRCLVPDYYPEFRCKQGSCRTPCCEGWPISFSMQDYFKLLSVPCSPDLRRRLDGALHLCEHPTQEHYAQLSPRWDGQCPLHLPDGRCQMHAELGPEMLSAVCRLYPRGMRPAEQECSCANSCEAVVEALLARREPLRFIPFPLRMELPQPPPRVHHFHAEGRELEIRLWLIAIVQDRAMPLPQRLMNLGSAMQALDAALSRRDVTGLDALLAGRTPVQAPPAPDCSAPMLQRAMDAAERMLAIIDRGSRSVHDYGEAALNWFEAGQDALVHHREAAERFARLVPEWEDWFANLLANHMFFAQFPFQDRPVPLPDEYLALCAVYVLLRMLCLGWTAEHPGINAAVDVCAAAFRLVEHTDFDRFAAALLRDMRQELPALLQL